MLADRLRMERKNCFGRGAKISVEYNIILMSKLFIYDFSILHVMSTSPNKGRIKDGEDLSAVSFQAPR